MFITFKKLIQEHYPSIDVNAVPWNSPEEVIFALTYISLSTPLLWEKNKAFANTLSYETSLELLNCLVSKKLHEKDYNKQEELMWFLIHCCEKSNTLEYHTPRRRVGQSYYGPSIYNEKNYVRHFKTVDFHEGYFASVHNYYTKFNIRITGTELDQVQKTSWAIRQSIQNRLVITGPINYEHYLTNESQRPFYLDKLDKKEAKFWFPYYTRKEFSTLLYKGDDSWPHIIEIYKHLSPEEKQRMIRGLNKQMRYSMPLHKIWTLTPEEKNYFNEIVSIKNRCKLGWEILNINPKLCSQEDLTWLGQEFVTSMMFWELAPFQDDSLSMLNSFAKNAMVKSRINMSHAPEECEIL